MSGFAWSVADVMFVRNLDWDTYDHEFITPYEASSS